VITTQEVLPDVPPVSEGFPMRKWSIRIAILGADGQELPANIFDKVTYKLHPTFQNPTRALKKPPFKIEEQGWGEFDLGIVLHNIDKGGENTISHDLNFAKNEYIVDHNLSFPTNRPNLVRALAESGPVPGYNAPGASGTSSEWSGERRKADESDTKVRKKAKTIEKGNVDLESLADGLQKLSEDDLLTVVQMVSDNKTPDMYIKNDVDEGEFHMDLFTLPDSLLRSLWDFVKKKIEA
jgi:transcription initiation factor TFIID/TFIIF subunit